MRKVMIAAALAALTATPALAADMAMKAPPAAVAPVYNWNGFYFGAHAGVGWSDGSAEANPLPSEAAFNELRHHFDIRAAGVLGGVQAGYNWITAPNWLAGLEVDGSWTGIRASASDNFLCSPSGGCSPGTTLMSRDLDWLASVRGRLGYVQGPWLLYVTGGFAAGGVHWAASSPSFPAGFLWATASKQTETGFVVGGGVEKALSADWTIRAEYLFYRLSGKGPVVHGVPPLPPFQFSYSWADFNTNVVRIALSRKFN